MFNKQVPMYIFNGFFESGKTRMIKDLLEDEQFIGDDKPLLIVCEEGEETYPEELLAKSHTKMVTVESLDELTYGFMAKLNKREKPDLVIIEYNGTWLMNDFFVKEFPAGWQLAQIITPVNAQTFDLYINNMRQIMTDHLICSDLILFNRCTPETPIAVYFRNMRMTNTNRASIVFEDMNGDVMPIDTAEILPYDMNEPVIDIADDDFGIFYVDAWENPDRYEGKEVRFTGMVYRDPQIPKGYFVPGRKIMTCCANDIRLMGYLCKSKAADKLKSNAWVKVTAKVHKEYMDLYQGEKPVLYATQLAAADKPENDYVSLY